MKLCAVLILCAVTLCSAEGVSVVVKNNEVYVDDKPVDLTKLQVIKDNAMYTKYELHSGQSVITIIKSKVGNAISVETRGPMTEEEKKKMKEMQNKVSEQVEKEIEQVQQNINKFNEELNQNINKVTQQIQSMFGAGFPFF